MIPQFIRICVIAFSVVLSVLLCNEAQSQCFTCAKAPVGTIWCDDFEDDIPLNQKYFEYDSNNGDFVVKDSVGRDKSQGMRVIWQKGEVAAGSIKKSFGKTPSTYIGKNASSPDSNFNEIYWRMDIRHQKNWQGGGPAKLMRALTLANANWATGMMAHLWSGGKDNLYLGMDPASGISENGILKTTKYNDFPNMRWLGFKVGKADIFSTLQSDSWQCIEGHVKLNTPNSNDGIFEFWINDTLQAGTYNLNWHGAWNESPDNMKINSIFFENYWNDGSPVQQERYFDNIVISTKRISCKCEQQQQTQREANLPQTDSVVTCFPDTTGYRRITVGSVNRDYTDLQKAIDDAQPGTLIILDAGSTFKGSYVLPKKNNDKRWIILMSSGLDLLPHEANRISPEMKTGDNEYPLQRNAMPKIITSNTAGVPCFITQNNAHHYRLLGLEITADTTVKNSYGLINFGDASKAQNSLNQVPTHLIIDRCYIHGHTKATIMKYGVGLNCSNGAVIDSYISDFHSIGFDAQAISGINGPGPFKILNNYLEASGENIMFGGGAPAIPGLVPSDIEIRQNYMYKPIRWRVGSPEYEGNHWTIKNLFELKTGVRVLLEGNILENSWADLPIGQSGYAILLTIRTEDNKASQAEVSDITIRNNIIKNCGSGISLSGKDDGGKGNRSKRITIVNNLFDNINGKDYGDQNINGPNDGTFIKIGEPEDVIIDHNTVFQTGAITWVIKQVHGFSFTNNVSNSKVSAAGYQGIYGPGFQQGNKTIAQYFPDITDATQRIHKNIFIGGDASKYTDFSAISKNYFPSNENLVGFVNFNEGKNDFKNYTLLSTSQYFKNGTDGLNIGADFSKIDSALNRPRKCTSSIIVSVQSIVLDKKILSLTVGDSVQLNAMILPINATNKKVMWASSNTNTASVTNMGKVFALQSGSAKIIVKTEDGGFSDTCFLDVLQVNSADDSDEPHTVKISPNPAREYITLNFRPESSFRTEIYDIVGRLIYSNENKTVIDISTFNNGIYILKIYEENDVIRRMFVKK